ncbi:hypothetical protein P175DRAFT_0441571 [Aspergillus ochraceoroseus IBT 24754]|uniref:Integral membrane protein n=1 Tax=Aspergillus ochraceoroseus IBT 24754 TaxID=1392256 RepID=A0A2T5LT87_9EURO|nr:uncharacterized protein P175DRAFT_0441571 [Aspergillus ochraceoroseus IBT 24754]PTU19487.1 hypothetical protein P175DRAFT_0441571 [Aspergillus ochraceoroseus IBT 24754]
MDSAVLSRRRQQTGQLLQPILRAYAVGYLSSTTPKVISSLRRIWKSNDLSYRQILDKLFQALTGSIRLESFPTFCASLVGGSTLLPVLFLRSCDHIGRRFGSKSKFWKSKEAVQLVRFVTSLASAWLSFRLLNRKPITLEKVNQELPNGDAQTFIHKQQGGTAGLHDRPEFAGRTMDLTLFTLIRAVDSLVCLSWERGRKSRGADPRWAWANSIAPRLADSALFAVSSAIVMWAWFYLPERLPKSYRKWIEQVAKVDNRLIEALRRVRRGVFVYGKDTGQAPLLEGMCKDFGWPIEWGDPSKTIPIPCEMVHMGCGPSCEKHAISRFAQTFGFACATYIPLQMAFRLRSMNSLESFRRAVVGPKIFDKETVTPLMWDSGLCVGAGCVMCGWSILVEHTRKRQEIALFVAPRAAATVLPRFYDKKYHYRERAVFAISAAILLTCFHERPGMVRGVFGRIGRSILT